MAYVVGLLATDGCLSSDRRHIILTSRDRELVETFLACLGRPIKYTVGRTRRGKRAYYAQFSDVTFYDWLLARGLTPRKSLTLGAIDVPNAFLIPLARGLLDGDGSVCVFRNRPTRAKYPNYEYERLWVFFLSASRSHIDWLRGRIKELVGLNGYVERIVRKKRHDLFRLNMENTNRSSCCGCSIPIQTRRASTGNAESGSTTPSETSVRKEGLEPSRPYGHTALNRTRLPNSATSA